MSAPEPRFSSGDRVADADADDPDPMRILGYARGPDGGLVLAPAYEIEAGRSAADVNDDEYRHDVVAECVYESWLDRHIPEPWGDWTGGDFGPRVKSFCREWGVSLDAGIYGYPDGRLEAVPEDDDGEETADEGFRA